MVVDSTGTAGVLCAEMMVARGMGRNRGDVGGEERGGGECGWGWIMVRDGGRV